MRKLKKSSVKCPYRQIETKLKKSRPKKYTKKETDKKGKLFILAKRNCKFMNKAHLSQNMSKKSPSKRMPQHKHKEEETRLEQVLLYIEDNRVLNQLDRNAEDAQNIGIKEVGQEKKVGVNYQGKVPTIIQLTKSRDMKYESLGIVEKKEPDVNEEVSEIACPYNYKRHDFETGIQSSERNEDELLTSTSTSVDYQTDKNNEQKSNTENFPKYIEKYVENEKRQESGSSLDSYYTPSQYESLQLIQTYNEPTSKEEEYSDQLLRNSEEFEVASCKLVELSDQESETKQNSDQASINLEVSVPTKVEQNLMVKTSQLQINEDKSDENSKKLEVLNSTQNEVSDQSFSQVDCNENTVLPRPNAYNDDGMTSTELEEMEGRNKQLSLLRAKAARTVYNGNKCPTHTGGYSKSKNCKDCKSMWRCMICDQVFKGPFSIIKKHILGGHLAEIDMTNEEKLEYLKMERLIIQWPYRKYEGHPGMNLLA